MPEQPGNKWIPLIKHQFHQIFIERKVRHLYYLASMILKKFILLICFVLASAALFRYLKVKLRQTNKNKLKSS